jgi:hypothetical protein
MARIRIKVSETLTKMIEKIPEAFNTQFGHELAKEVIDSMKKDISKGLSPIQGKGRFAAYKGQTKSKAGKEKAKQLGSAGDKRGAKAVRQQVKKQEKKTYPFTVQKDYPGKRVRPVNLHLSGDFLNSLVWKVLGTGKAFEVAIGFFDSLSVKKEHGHRYMVGGQPSRPTIPIGEEVFSERIMRLLVKLFRKRQRKALSK